MEPVIRARKLSHQGNLMQRHLNEIDAIEKLEAKHFEGMNYTLEIRTGAVTKEQRERLIDCMTEALEQFKKNEITDVEERIQCLFESWIDKECEVSE